MSCHYVRLQDASKTSGETSGLDLELACLEWFLMLFAETVLKVGGHPSSLLPFNINSSHQSTEFDDSFSLLSILRATHVEMSWRNVYSWTEFVLFC